MAQRGKPERAAPVRVEEPVFDYGFDLGALATVGCHGVQPFHDKYGPDDLVGRVAIKIGLGQPAGVATAVSEANA